MQTISDFYKNQATANHDQDLTPKWYHTYLAYDDRYVITTKFLDTYLRDDHARILDVACGTGIYERMMTPAVRSAQHVVGVDISGPHIEINKSLGAFDELIECDITAGLPFGDGEFDVVILSEIIEHLFEPEDIIRECHRVLKKNGILILSTPNVGSLQNRLSFLIFGTSGEIDYLHNFQHIRFFSKKALRKISDEIFGKGSLIYERGYSCLFFYPHNFPFYLPCPRFLQRMFSFLFPNSGNGFFKVYKK